jgi:hypothetical protein
LKKESLINKCLFNANAVNEFNQTSQQDVSFCAGFLTLEKIKDPLLILSLDEIETPELKFFKTPIDENLSSGLPEKP